MASVTDPAHLCSLDCVPVFCPFSEDNHCPAGLEFCPSMRQRMCVDAEPADRTDPTVTAAGGEAGDE